MKKLLIILGIVVLIIGLSIFWFYGNVITVFTKKIIYINTATTKETIYLKRTQSGLNYDEVVISKSSRRKSKASEDYIYTWDETLFYKVSSDSLYVYCKIKIEKPSNFDSKIKVVQIQYSNPEYYDFLKSYKKKGLEKFPSE